MYYAIKLVCLCKNMENNEIHYHRNYHISMGYDADRGAC